MSKSLQQSYARMAREQKRRASLTVAQRDVEDRTELDRVQRNHEAATNRARRQTKANLERLELDSVGFVSALTTATGRDKDFLNSILEQISERPLSVKQVSAVKVVVKNHPRIEGIETLAAKILTT